jgi:UvrB/uvrC motif
MNEDIDAALKNWEFKPGEVQAREVQASDGRPVLQLRLDLGILQMEVEHRPDGTRPHDFPTYFDFLASEAAKKKRAGGRFVLSEQQCHEADREFIQYYQRRVCWLALGNFGRAVADADHTLAFMDFVRDHSPNEEYTDAHEQYRGFVLFHRTEAAAALQVQQNQPERALDEIATGLEQLQKFFSTHEAQEQMEENPMVQQLRKMDQSLRQKHGIEATLREQLAQAVANEQYEEAAKLRDALRRRE